MNPELHPRVFEILGDMGKIYLVDTSYDYGTFVNRLEAVNELCEEAGGQLYSRQVIAMMVEQYEREKNERDFKI